MEKERKTHELKEVARVIFESTAEEIGVKYGIKAEELLRRFYAFLDLSRRKANIVDPAEEEELLIRELGIKRSDFEKFLKNLFGLHVIFGHRKFERIISSLIDDFMRRCGMWDIEKIAELVWNDIEKEAKNMWDYRYHVELYESLILAKSVLNLAKENVMEDWRKVMEGILIPERRVFLNKLIVSLWRRTLQGGRNAIEEVFEKVVEIGVRKCVV